MRYVATGRVLPERCAVSFGRIEMGLADGGKAFVSCDSSQLTVVIEGAVFDGRHSAYITAEQLASLMSNSLGFALGFGYSVEIVQILQEDGMPFVYGVGPIADHPETLGFGDQYTAIFNRIFRLSGTDVFFRFAVADFVRAITDSSDCATFCYRSIESLKSGISFRTGNNGWAPMHDALGTNREKIEQTIKRFADPVRHGNWITAPATTGAERIAMLELTRDIISAYLGHVAPDDDQIVGRV